MQFAPSSVIMNNSSNSNSNNNNYNAHPFNFSTSAAAAMDGSSYCQNISTAPSSSPQGSVGINVIGQSHNDQRFSNSQQQQPGGGAGGASATDAMLSAMPSSPNQASQTCCQSCRFCQQKFYTTSERLLEHEISCPMHLQVQQFLQKQQQSEMQRQLQMQQDQLEQQFNIQQQQAQQQAQQQQQVQQVDSSYSMSNALGGGIGQYMSSNGNSFQRQLNDLQASQAHLSSPQSQYLNSLLQQQQNQNNASATRDGQHTTYHKHQVCHQASTQASAQTSPPATSSSLDNLRSNNEDQFETAINGLPAFDPKPLSSSFTSTTSASNNRTADYFPLAMPEDEEWLTPLHCFVRRYCVEVFVATPEDVAAPCMGKRNPVTVNQVGIRCPYCSPERTKNKERALDVARARENGVVYPSLISRMYNSSINLLQRHLRTCAFVPPEVLAKYEDLKSSNARSGASKKYWADSATKLGLVDAPDGIKLDKAKHEAHLMACAQGGVDQHKSGVGVSSTSSLTGGSVPEAPPLVLPSDKRNTTAFTFHLITQMQPCVFTEADRLGRRRGLKVGFAGLACRHCFGAYGSGRFFPSSVKTMSDASKTLDVIYRHVLKCKSCPGDIKGGLKNLRDFHDSERSKMPFGNQRAFFVKIWGRLHETMGDYKPAGMTNPIRMPALMSMATAAAAITNPSIVPSHNSIDSTEASAKSNAYATLVSGDSIHGLYAMVKRENESDHDSTHNHNKLTSEAA
mmetsp:Transcript_21492/g.44977  ORF Transcript_21492/g.44977 Transcript_21492/m.44977 type:complete len:738 (+) Transcript_21492:74-2287(+)